MQRTALATVMAFLLGVVTLAVGGEIPLSGSAAFPAAMGRVSFEHDRNHNMKFHVQAKHLARPDALTPSKSVYVVWLQPRSKDTQNAGTLSVNENLEGSLTGTTPSQTFDLIITAEDNANAERPSGPEILRGTIQAH